MIPLVPFQTLEGKRETLCWQMERQDRGCSSGSPLPAQPDPLCLSFPPAGHDVSGMQLHSSACKTAVRALHRGSMLLGWALAGPIHIYLRYIMMRYIYQRYISVDSARKGCFWLNSKGDLLPCRRLWNLQQTVLAVTPTALQLLTLPCPKYLCTHS